MRDERYVRLISWTLQSSSEQVRTKAVRQCTLEAVHIFRLWGNEGASTYISIGAVYSIQGLNIFKHRDYSRYCFFI
jgi:hypothetical protein